MLSLPDPGSLFHYCCTLLLQMKHVLKRTLLISSLSVLLVLIGCFGSARKEGEALPEEIYFEYTVTGEEGNDSISVVMKFKEYDRYGQAVSIEPGGVVFDGSPVAVDSTTMTGPYYAMNRHIRDFAGKHTIQVTLPNYKKYKEDFTFKPFTFKSGISDTIRRAKMQLQFEGLSNKEIVRVLLTDTSFTGDGINRLDTVWFNRIIITRGDLSYLENGPINLELTRESEKPLRNGTEAGGSISIFYSIRREFWLQD